MEINIDIIILLIITFTFGVLVSLNLKKSENIVNLDDSSKIELSTCCTDPLCYNKPPHLRNCCSKIKVYSKEELDKLFRVFYTPEEYNKKLDELQLNKSMSSNKINDNIATKLARRITIRSLDKETHDKIRMDDRDEAPGYDKKVLAPHIVSVVDEDCVM